MQSFKVQRIEQNMHVNLTAYLKRKPGLRSVVHNLGRTQMSQNGQLYDRPLTFSENNSNAFAA